MKKVFLFSAVFVAIASLFVSCDNEFNDKNLEEVYYDVSVVSAGGGNVLIDNDTITSMPVLANTDVVVVAIPEEGCDFIGWFIDGSKTPISTETPYRFVVNENVCLVAKFYRKPVAIDLGLSVKWASFNVDATSPDEEGGYYAWGEIEEKRVYDWETYKWCNGSSTTITKYCTNENYGVVDNKMTLEPDDDVAHVKWGGNWRMPTTEEQIELLKNCKWQWVFFNTTYGCKVTGPNGNSIFLPATGYRIGVSTLLPGDIGYYWSSSLYNGDYSNGAYDLFFDFSKECGRAAYARYYGNTVRPVCE